MDDGGYDENINGDVNNGGMLLIMALLKVMAVTSLTMILIA